MKEDLGCWDGVRLMFPLKGRCSQSSLAEVSSMGWFENLAIEGSDQSTDTRK